MIRGGFRVLTLALLVLAIFAVFACASPTPGPTPIPQDPTLVAPEPTPAPAPNPVPPAPPTHGVVNFHIISHQTGRPVRHAEVTIGDNPVAFTDDSGNYAVDLPYGKSLRLIIYHGEYRFYEEAWTFDARFVDVTIALDSLR